MLQRIGRYEILERIAAGGPGTETALSVPPAADQFLPVVGLEVLRSELRQGDGT